MIREKCFNSVIKLTSILFVSLMLMVPLILFIYSIPLLNINGIATLLFSNWSPSSGKFGLSTFIQTTIITGIGSTIISSVIAFSLSYIIFFHKENKTGKTLNNFITAMAGVPTIVYSIAGMFFLVPFIAKYSPSPTGLCLLTVILVLSFVILPTITILINQALNNIPSSEINAALSLGAKKHQLFFKVMIPETIKSIAAAIVIGFGRATGDTLVALVLSGNALSKPSSLFSSSRNLTSHIAMLIPGEFDSVQYKTIFVSAGILLVITLVLSVIAYQLEKNRC